MERNKNESYLSFVKRCTHAVSDGLIDYDEWSNSLLGAVRYASTENMRRSYNLVRQLVENIEEDDFNNFDEDKLSELVQAKEELEKERIKIQTANLEYNTNKRNNARLELFDEYIKDAIGRLKPIDFSGGNYRTNLEVKQDGVLCIADAHNGVEVNMKTLFGDLVNVYNSDVLIVRLQILLDQIENDQKRFFNYDHLTVFDLGDAIQGILRMSDLAKLKTGVIDSTIEYAEIISHWLVRLSERLQVPIEYICLGGNHAELRLLNGRKGDFDAENMGKVIQRFVELRLESNPNITVAPYSECGFKTIQGINILAYHGDDAKNDFEEIAFWENYHQIDIDILIEGHLHHKQENSVGYGISGGDKEVIHIPSLIGADTFGKKCRKISKAGAKFFLIEDGIKTWERTYILN